MTGERRQLSWPLATMTQSLLQDFIIPTTRFYLYFIVLFLTH